MRIGIYISGINETSGGAYTFEQGILKSLLKLKGVNDLYVFYYSEVERPKESQIKFVKLERPITPSLFIKLFGKLIRIFVRDKKTYLSPLDKAVKQNHIEVLWYATDYYQPVDIPYIYTTWDLEHRAHPFFPEVNTTKYWSTREKRYRQAIPRAAFVITGTEIGKQQVARFYQVLEKRIKVIPFPAPNLTNTLQDKNYDLEKDFNIQNDYLFYPASYHPHKNHIRILETLVVLGKKHHLKISAVFVGADCSNKTYLEKKCQEFNLQDQVKFLDFVSISQLIYLYKHAFALIFPTYFGPDNIPPLEAFSLKCPVIASNISGAEEQLGNKAILVDPNSPEDFASAVVKLKKNSAFRKQMVTRAFNHVNKWTFDDYTNSVFTLINNFSAIRSCWSNDNSSYY